MVFTLMAKGQVLSKQRFISGEVVAKDTTIKDAPLSGKGLSLGYGTIHQRK